MERIEPKPGGIVLPVFEENAIVLHADGQFHTVEFPESESELNTLLHSTVNGSPERVATYVEGERYDLWVNDEFLVIPDPPPFNVIATFFHMLGLKDEFKDTAFIAGDAILTGGVSWDGMTQSLRPEQTMALLDLIASIKEAVEHHRRRMEG
jgi:hypothetical protein